MTSGVRTSRLARALSAAALCALALAGCSAQADAGTSTGADDQKQQPAAADQAHRASPRAEPTASTASTASTVPVPAAFKGVRINIADRQTVGVGMPISVTFDRPVPATERAAVERLLTVETTTGVTGSWSWIKDRNLLDGQRVDYRPRDFWKPGTEVTVRAGSGGSGSPGSPSHSNRSGLTRHFTVGRSLVATVDVRTHTMTVEKDGTTRRVPITAGAPGMDTWNGTMVVSDKQRRVLMDSRTVGYGDAYKGYYAYAVHLTTSGTYLHENPKADTYAGRQNVTHGCVGLATDGTARRFYEEVIPGDVVRVTGSTETVAAGNGYGDWNLGWDEWRAGSALR
ncbi:L,D-transpeptidase family protein [Streptomyces sp. SID4917]|nr:MULTISPECIES: L,D-transpeptidase [unclassified Streptomyces]MYZ34501.1 L,D-transpeptidase family protein [Streptomyces sp. SID4917]SCF67770.1 L,D-transpeptidase catalytic domain [Streptomyces sp. MnatMP-M17]